MARYQGCYLRARNEPAAKRAERIGAVSGFVVVIAAVAVSLASNWSELGQEGLLPPRAYAAVALVAPGGMCFAACALYVRQVLVRRAGSAQPASAEALGGPSTEGLEQQPAESAAVAQAEVGPAQWVTVCLETGIQNVPLALAVVNLSLLRSGATGAEVLSAQLLAAIWSVIVNCEAVLLVGVVRARTRALPAAEPPAEPP